MNSSPTDNTTGSGPNPKRDDSFDSRAAVVSIYPIERTPGDRPSHPPTGVYVRRFWVPVVGIEAAGCYLHLVEAVQEGRTELVLSELALSLGMSRAGRVRALLRKLAAEGLVVADESTLGVPLAAPCLDEFQEDRLPPREKSMHQRLRRALQESSGTTGARLPVGEMRNRAYAVAVSMLRLGESAREVERSLHRRGFHPAIAHQAIREALADWRPTTDTACEELADSSCHDQGRVPRLRLLDPAG